METIHEYMTSIKAAGYLFSLLFLLASVAFWRYLLEGDEEDPPIPPKPAPKH